MGVDVTLLEVAKIFTNGRSRSGAKSSKRNCQKWALPLRLLQKIDQVTDKEVIVAGKAVAYDRLLVAAGRKPDLTLASQLEIELDEASRFVRVNNTYQTSIPSIYAIGDVIGGYQLAHVCQSRRDTRCRGDVLVLRDSQWIKHLSHVVFTLVLK